ncbi:hypothetical protein [Sphingomonas sp.]|uniref:hypothetical protein n=1 Tax=Sphingomonas sp. TaxID=28214 RepID=UPI0025F917AD|nr:hypothetical protein [Sphingomonas sp.]
MLLVKAAKSVELRRTVDSWPPTYPTIKSAPDCLILKDAEPSMLPNDRRSVAGLNAMVWPTIAKKS